MAGLVLGLVLAIHALLAETRRKDVDAPDNPRIMTAKRLFSAERVGVGDRDAGQGCAASPTPAPRPPHKGTRGKGEVCVIVEAQLSAYARFADG